MAKEYSQKSNFPSKYSPGNFVSPAQKIVEVLCENIAIQKKTTLPNQFWELPEWNKLFRNQIAAANSLLKTYDISAILKILRDKKWSWVNSLRNKKFVEAIKSVETLTKLEDEAELQLEIPKPVETFGRKNTTMGILDKLKELE